MASAERGTARARDGPAPTVDVLHGRPVSDPYRWLEDPDSPATRDWLERRAREFAASRTAWPLRDPLADSIRRLVRTDLYSPPAHRRRRVFYTRRDAGADHPRLLVADDAGERVLVDPMAADPSGLTTLDGWEPDPDGRWVAVQTSTGGTERGTLRVLSADTGAPAEEAITGLRYSHVAWVPGPTAATAPVEPAEPAAGVPAFYYVRRDGARRGVWLHRVGAGADTLVRACPGPRTVPGVRLLGGRWLVVSESHGTGHRTDLWIADIATGDSGTVAAPRWAVVHEGCDAVTTIVDVAPTAGAGQLFLRTTLGAPRGRVCVADPAAPGPGGWRELVPQDPGATVDGLALAGDGSELLVARTRLGISELTAHDPHDGRPLGTVELPGEGMVTGLERGADGRAYLCYADVARQQTVLRVRTGERRARPWPEGTGVGRAPPPPRVRRRTVWCDSTDSTRVAVTVFALAPPTASPVCPLDGPAPTILHAYGGFGRPRQFGFSATVLAWLLAGGRYAVAHVRGGGDAGRRWHMAGARRNKINAVRDLIAAADALVAAGYCTRGQMCLSGGSAGGLLVLAAATLRPDLCSAVIALAPLADMARFERLGLGPMWTREFGTADDPGDFHALMSYSPYHRALEHPGTRSPAVLLTGFHGDTRTDAAHPRKMCAALRATATPERPVLLRYEHDVGHGPRAVSRAIDLAADAHAFAAAHTGLSPRGESSRPNRKRGEDTMDPMEVEVEVEDLAEVTSRDITAGGDNDGTDSSSDFI